jgi:hypothetical protein
VSDLATVLGTNTKLLKLLYVMCAWFVNQLIRCSLHENALVDLTDLCAGLQKNSTLTDLKCVAAAVSRRADSHCYSLRVNTIEDISPLAAVLTSPKTALTTLLYVWRESKKQQPHTHTHTHTHLRTTLTQLLPGSLQENEISDVLSFSVALASNKSLTTLKFVAVSVFLICNPVFVAV